MPKVFVTRCDRYDEPLVVEKVDAAFAALGGIERFVQHGRRVLVKPNLLFATPAEKAITTHPLIVDAVVRRLADCGAKISIGDSPGVGKGVRAAERAGIGEVARRYGAEVVEFEESVEVQVPEGGLFRRIEVARVAMEAETIINLPKFKSHGQMILTLAVKNLFGCVVGHRKAQWHMAAGRDRDGFARLLLELARIVGPALNIVDGVIGMDGNGPSAGRVRPVGVILAGEDPLAVDRVAAQIARLPEDRFPLVRAAGLLPDYAESLGEIELLGDPLEAVVLNDFNLPAGSDVEFGPRFIRRMFKRALTARPRVRHKLCERCGICIRSCPPEAMRLDDAGVVIDHSRCISCFCCHEMCPKQAIDVQRGWLAKLLIKRR